MEPQVQPAVDGPSDPLAELAGRAPTDDDAARLLVRHLQADVWRLCRALVDEQTAEDLTQETFLRVLQALPAYRADASVRTWTLAIARKTCMDHLRRLTRRRALDVALRRERRPASRPLGGLVEGADLLARLPLDLRTAFVLTQLLGLGYAEAAEVAECPVGTIRSRVARARSALAEQLRSTHEGRG